jgi:transcriptional regulator with XRE-family HTH domain
MKLGTKIRLLRAERDMSQGDLAKKIGADQGQISGYERDEALPSVPVIKKIAEVFDVTTDYLLFEDNEEKSTSKIKDRELIELIENYDSLAEKDRLTLKGIVEIILTKTKIQKAATA